MEQYYILLALLLMSLIFVSLVPIIEIAHRDGCHQWHSCPSDSGSYVYGDLGYDDEC